MAPNDIFLPPSAMTDEQTVIKNDFVDYDSFVRFVETRLCLSEHALVRADDSDSCSFSSSNDEKSVDTSFSVENALIRAELSSVSSISSGSDSDEALNKIVLPTKKGRHGVRSLRHRIFTLYRRLFLIVFVGNLTAILTTVRFSQNPTNLANLGTAVAGNLAFAVLMRQDHVVNLLFTIACSAPTSAPLWLRRNLAKIYHLGGLHSGCAIAATFWLVIFCVASTITKSPVAVQIISYLILALLLGIIAMAHPILRAKLHDKFELTHRFAGWTSLALFWIQIILLSDSQRGSSPLGTTLIKSPAFWLLGIATGSVILPWLSLRKVPMQSEVLSNHAVQFHFKHCYPGIGTTIPLSTHPLTEWHKFATIVKPGVKGFSVIVSNAGDWTSHQIRNSPTSMWIRGSPAYGVLRIVPLFKSVVLVCTGSGIGPCLPIIHMYGQRVPLRILWSTPNPEQTFGKNIIESIREADPKAVVHNTRTMGRPDMVAMTYRLLVESGAEAVCVVSNKKVTQKVVYAMEARGVPAFGPIFDS